jgi:hypothetical protein
MTARKLAVWFGTADLATAACLVALFELLLPFASVGGGCMSSLGALIVYASVVLGLVACGIGLLLHRTAGPHVCLAVGALSLGWLAIGTLDWLTLDRYAVAGSVSARLLSVPFVWLLAAQLVPAVLLLRGRERVESVESPEASGL